MFNRKKLIILLYLIIFVAGCNSFVVPISFIVPGIIDNTINMKKNNYFMKGQKSKTIGNQNTPLENGSNVSLDHISGASMSKHISGTSSEHISGASGSEHISGSQMDHISGASINKHISGASVPEHLSGVVVMPEHLSGN